MATYKAAVEWIAENDNAGNGDSVVEIAEYITTCMVADLWGKREDDVANDVRKARVRIGNANREAAVNDGPFTV